MTSAKIKTTIVNINAVIRGDGLPKTLRAIEVAIDAARKLTKLLPIRITPISLSGVSRSFLARRAPLCPVRLRWLSRYLFRLIMLVSDEEKYAEAKMRMTKEVRSVSSDVSSGFIQSILR